jgi:hypothetical protein
LNQQLIELIKLYPSIYERLVFFAKNNDKSPMLDTWGEVCMVAQEAFDERRVQFSLGVSTNIIVNFYAKVGFYIACIILYHGA